MDVNSNPFFSAAVAHMAATADGDGRALARVHNFRFDPRVGGLREQNYYENLALENDSPEHLEERHNRYVREKVWTPSCPETFMSENCAAFLDKMDDAQDLIRLVNVDTLLVLVDSDQGCNGKDKAFNLLKEKLLLAQKGIKEAVALIEVWVDQWNQKQHDGPRFSAPKKHIQPLVDAANWTELLRDRLGLAGFDSSRTPYVALMGYTVGEVRRAARKKHIDTPFAVPTVLDLPVSEYFFPAPLAPFPGETQSFGRTMALQPVNDPSQLVAELLHVKLDYEPEHVLKVERMAALIPDCPFWELRNHHLTALRLGTGLVEYGEEIPGPRS